MAGLAHRHRLAASLVATALLALTTGCGSGDSEPSASSTTSTTTKETDVRSRLATALATTDPTRAALLEQSTTSLSPLDAPWLTGWRIIDVNSDTVPHPQRFFVALAEDDRALLLSGAPDAFNEMVADAAVSLDTPEKATAVAETFLDATRSFSTYSYRINSLDEVKWRSGLNESGTKLRDSTVASYGAQVTAPTASAAADGWTVTAWAVEGTDLVRHALTIASDGAVSDKPVTVVAGLPVPVSL
ncbi:hypothetical protein [Nocardioides sp.]|uniref:hypothetical protein n=1 Tax=Nocardioides sp. TaxID=35761 RepID=UPI0039E56469